MRDSAAVLDATAGPVAGDPYWAPPRRGPSFAAAAEAPTHRLRIAVLAASPTGSDVHPDCVAAVHAAATLCESLGHQLEEAVLDVDRDAFLADFVNAWAAGNAWAIADWEARLGRAATEGERGAADVGTGRSSAALSPRRSTSPSVQGLQHGHAPDRRRLRVVRHLGDPDPGRATGAARDLRLAAGRAAGGAVPGRLLRALHALPFNVSGQPAVSLPLGWNEAGLPIGVQFVGRLGDEETLLGLAGELERAAPWAARRPPVSV